MKVLALDPATSREQRWRAKQAAHVVEADVEEARVVEQHPTLSLDLRLRTFAHGRLIGFFAAVVLGGIATFTITDYDPETDKIHRFYGHFNPCILFDHYPANLVGLVFIGFMVLADLGFNAVLFLRLQSMGNLWVTGFLGMAIGICFCLELCFVNVFSANLYHLDDGHVHRRLHDPEIRDAWGFTREDIKAVAHHTNWFSLWLLAQLIMAFVLIWLLRLLCRSRFDRGQSFLFFMRHAFLFFTIFSMLVGIGQMTVLLLAAGVGDEEWPNHTATTEGSTTIQKAIMQLEATRSGLWFWMPAFALLYTLPKNVGVKLVISLKDTAVDKHEPQLIQPAQIIGASFRIFSLLLIGTYFFTDVDQASNTFIKMAAGFRAAPFSYFFAPVWLFMVAHVAIGVALTLTQHVLLGCQAAYADWVGALMVLFMYSCLCIVIPQFEHSGYLSVPLVLCAAAWVVVAYRGNEKPSKGVCWQYGYALLIVLCALASALHAAGGVLLLITFLAYEFVVPELPGLLVELYALPDELPEETV